MLILCQLLLLCAFYIDDTVLVQTLDIEGCVAEAFRRLEGLCESTLMDMMDVLRNNPQLIHSFRDFNTRYCQDKGCCMNIPTNN